MGFIAKLLLFLIIMSVSLDSYSQYQERDLIQFSGVIVSQDSLKPIPFSNISIKNTKRGTMTDFYGFFSFVAKKNDTIEMSSVGYKRAVFIIPDTLTVNRYSLIQALGSDTVMLTETVIYPWPTTEQFKQAFLKTQIPEDDYERAKKNLALAEMKERYKAMGMDAGMNYKNYIDNRTSKLYYAGQYPANNLLNPFAWAKFIKAWREGKFKREKKSDE
jgi:hypothetical protein